MKSNYSTVIMLCVMTIMFWSKVLPMRAASKVSNQFSRALAHARPVTTLPYTPQPRLSLCASMARLSIMPRKEVVKLLDTHIDEVLKTMARCHQLRSIRPDRSAAEFSWLPGYMVKLDISRIQGAQIIQEIITTRKLDLLKLPDQWHYKIPATKATLQLSDLCVGTKIEGEIWKPITLQQAMQLRVLCKYAPFCDPKAPNLIHCKERVGKREIGLCDTQLEGIGLDEYQALCKLFHENKLDDDAREYIQYELKKLKRE